MVSGERTLLVYKLQFGDEHASIEQESVNKYGEKALVFGIMDGAGLYLALILDRDRGPVSS